MPLLLLVAPLAVGNLLTILFYVVIICLIGYIAFWLVNYLAPPEPIRKVSVVIIVVLLLLVLLSLLFGVTPQGLSR